MRDWLKKRRENASMTASEVARLSGISQPCYSQIELGIKNPSVKTAKAIALTLNFQWSTFFEPCCESESST